MGYCYKRLNLNIRFKIDNYLVFDEQIIGKNKRLMLCIIPTNIHQLSAIINRTHIDRTSDNKN